jgi:histone H2A deubiquitinase
MDPTSELEARDAFHAKNLNVIGWYHSHPTFDPQPSIRDIENQAMYQVLINFVCANLRRFVSFQIL